jgi:N-acetylglucosaminyl-diphospho-decaprenol L-rhamnosyltransferase
MGNTNLITNDSHLAGRGRPCLAVIVVTYNSARVIGGLLDSLPEGLQGIAETEVIIVDNNSKDRSVAIAASHPVAPRIIQTGRNAGYAAAINAAAAVIDEASHILVLNPDTRLLPGCALTMVDRLLDNAIGIAVPQLLEDDGALSYSLRREPSVVTSWSDSLFGTRLAGQWRLGEIVMTPGLYRHGGNVEWATGAVLAVSSKARRLVGDWDESFFLYSEEVDYMERVRASGLGIVYEPQARAVHIGGEYHENTHLSALMTSNRILYFERHHNGLSTFLFRMGIIAGAILRFGLGPGHRAALAAAIRPYLEYRAVLQR